MRHNKYLHFNLNGNEKHIVNFEDKSLDLQALISALRHDHKNRERRCFLMNWTDNGVIFSNGEFLHLHN